MPNYERLRELVSHRVTFDYDTGARIVGYISTVKPAEGNVEVVVMSKAKIFGSNGALIESHDEFSLVPNVLANYRLTEGPS